MASARELAQEACAPHAGVRDRDWNVAMNAAKKASDVWEPLLSKSVDILTDIEGVLHKSIKYDGDSIWVTTVPKLREALGRPAHPDEPEEEPALSAEHRGVESPFSREYKRTIVKPSAPSAPFLPEHMGVQPVFGGPLVGAVHIIESDLEGQRWELAEPGVDSPEKVFVVPDVLWQHYQRAAAEAEFAADMLDTIKVPGVSPFEPEPQIWEPEPELGGEGG